jgi:uncharacterized protein (DUF302 family)
LFASYIVAAFLALAAILLAAASPPVASPADPQLARGGVVQIGSADPMADTIDRLEHHIASKGITFFTAIGQANLGAVAGIPLDPSTLLMFGNPALGVQFITSSPAAGLDWPVRLLVYQDAAGIVWAAYTDFAWIARRHRIADREAALSKASEVNASITSSIGAR